MDEESAACVLEYALSGRTPKEQFDALSGNERLWWKYCRDAVRRHPDWHTAWGRIEQISSAQAPSEEASRSFQDAARAVVTIAKALIVADNNDYGSKVFDSNAKDMSDFRKSNNDALRSVVRHWAATGLLVSTPAGAGLLSAKSLSAVEPEFRNGVSSLVCALDGLEGGPARAMAALTALMLGGVSSHQGRVIRVPVLFDRLDSVEGTSGILEVYELVGGPAGLFPDPEAMSFTSADSGFNSALSHAWAYAARGMPMSDCILWRLTLQDNSPIASIEGRSLGAPFAIALQEFCRSQLRRKTPWGLARASFRSLRPKCAITGVINADGTLAAVGGMPAKLEAARNSRWQLVAPESNQAAAIYDPAEVRIFWAATLSQANRNARRWRPVRIAITAVTALTLVVTISAIGVAVFAGRAATTEHDAVVSSQLIAQSELMGDANPAISQLESIAAWRIDPSAEARYAMLNAVALPGLVSLAAGGGDIPSIAFSPSGEIMATASANGTVRLWNVVSHRQIGKPLGTGDSINTVAFSPDGRTLVGGGHHGSVWFWDVATQHQVRRLSFSDPRSLPAAFTPIFSVAFSPDGKILAVGSADGAVRLWDVAAHHQIGPPLKARPLLVPADAADGGDALHGLVPEQGTYPINSVAFSSDGKYLATANSDGTVRLWDMSTERESPKPISVADLTYESIAFSPDGKILAVIDKGVQLWDIAGSHKIGRPISAHGQVQSVAFSPDGNMLAIGNKNGTVTLWDVSTRRQIGESLTGAVGMVNFLAFSPNSKLLAAGNADGTARLWNVTAVRWIGSALRSAPGNANDSPESVAFSPKGLLLATVGSQESGRVWNLATHQYIGIPIRGSRCVVAFSPDGRILATSSETGAPLLWDVGTQRRIGKPLGPGSAGPISVSFSPDGKILAVTTGGVLGGIRLWDVASRRQIGILFGKESRGASDVDFSPDGKILATGNDDGTVELWDVATHRRIGRPFARSTTSIVAVAFSPNGRALATVDEDGMLRLWDVATHRQLGGPVTGSDGGVDTVAFSPNGRILATGSPNGIVRLWDVATHLEIGDPLTPHDGGPVVSVAFSPDGRTLATVNDYIVNGGTTYLWNVAYLAGNISRHVCTVAGRSLTHAEWTRYVPSGPAYRKVCA